MIILSQDVHLSLIVMAISFISGYLPCSEFIIHYFHLYTFSLVQSCHLLRGINFLSVAELMICDSHNTQPRDSKSYHHDGCGSYLRFFVYYINFEWHFGLSVTRQFWFYAPLWMFLFLLILFEYWIEHIIIVLLSVTFRLSIKIFYRGVPGFATDCPCSVWCCGLTNFGPLFGNRVWNDSSFLGLA